MRAAIIVLGDFGRSPRMQYHALALADSNAEVDVVGYEGAVPLRAVSEHPRIKLHLIAPLSLGQRSGLAQLPFIACASARIAAQGALLLWMMLRIARPDLILVQNPPALPTLAVCLIVARIRSSKLVIDWHNFSYSMLALKLGRESQTVRILRFLEMALGRRADFHLCVSQAMKSELRECWAIPQAVVFRDRPAATFSPTPAELRMALVQRCLGGEQTLLNGTRPAIVVCPTSWTVDEDLSILINAAARYDLRARASRSEGSPNLPALLILITGTGPLRAYYETQIGRMKLDKVSIQTLWLPSEDYVLLIGSASGCFVSSLSFRS